MKLENLFSGDHHSVSVYAERYLNDKKGSFHDYSEVNPRYDPQGELPQVILPYTVFPSERCVVYKSFPSPELVDWVYDGKGYKFFWHPDVVRSTFHVDGHVPTQPTSSTRTLFTEHSLRVYIKTDLDKKHFRFIRRLQRSSVEHSIAINSDLHQFVNNSPMLSRYSFLPESLAVVVIGGEHEGSGVLYRESTPYPFVSEERVRVPFHALYALDQFVPEDEPLLVQLVRLNGGSSPLRYFVEEVAGLILEAWVLLVSKRGLLPELHGQNSLAEIDATLTLRRMVHRDFQGTYSDPRIRVMKGLPIFTKHVVGVEPGTTVQSQYSHVFDGMIGRYLLERLTKTFCRYFGREYVAVVKAIAAYHKSLPGWDAADFPKTTFRFGDQAKEQIGNEVRLVDTGLLPEFR